MDGRAEKTGLEGEILFQFYPELEQNMKASNLGSVSWLTEVIALSKA